MKSKLRRTALVDTCFWYALFKENDRYHQNARDNVDVLFNLYYIVPWPTLYETLNTTITKYPEKVLGFEKFLKRPNAILLDDSKYKAIALEAIFTVSNTGKYSCSLVDNILRMIIEDIDVRVDCIFTFNQRDFIDICRKRKVELLPYETHYS
jgi:predicted nucleic acid-binding protein